MRTPLLEAPPAPHPEPEAEAETETLISRLGAFTTRHRDQLLFAAVMAIAFFLRMWSLGRIGFRGDEAVYAGQASVLAGIEPMDRFFILISRGNSNFLLYQWLVSIPYRLFGFADVTARLLSAGFSTATVALTYAMGRSLYRRGSTGPDRWTPLYAALFVAVSGYVVALGRLALLDSTLMFFFTLSLFFVAKWTETGRTAWLYAFAAAAALAIETKVVGVLLFVILAAYLVLNNLAKWMRLRTPIVAGTVFAAVFLPVLVQLVFHGSRFLELLQGSSQRASHVPWYYYVKTVAGYDGVVLAALWGVAVVIALKRRSRADLLPGLAILVVVGFYQLYPLKGFNYLLPIMPALALLAGRSVSWASTRLPGKATVVALVAAVLVLTAPRLQAHLQDESSAGMREAAFWLKEHTPADAGVMTLSNGSAQYIFSIYGHRDAYPFGRFRLATVLPGGTVVTPRPTTEGTPRDWVTFQPTNLIESGTVSYLVYYTRPLDDPPEDDDFVRSSVQGEFRDLIERYGGELRHTIYRNHEGRVWIYELTRELPKPVIGHSLEAGSIKVEGRGFKKGSQVDLSYLHQHLATTTADADGSISVTVPMPPATHPSFQLIAVDSAGNHATITNITSGGS